MSSSSRPVTEQFEVVIVGAGPTGVLAANLLGKYGVSTLVVDREADILTIPRAVGICEEGSRILDAAGIVVPQREVFHTINAVHFVDAEFKSRLHADVDWRKDGYRAIRMFHQPDLERAMRASAVTHDSVELRTSTELVEFHQEEGGVHLVLEHSGERTQLRCRFLLACDGARSEIRKAMGIGFSGKTYEQDWVILDIENDPVRNNDVAFGIDPRRPSVTMPGPGGRRRWEFVVKSDDDVEQVFADENVPGLISHLGDMSDVRVARKALYTFHARTAECYQRGNVFLLGDSAHVTPPFAGQGMMAGLRDAYNLCWKLAGVLEGRLGSQVLATYERERIPQSKQIIHFAQFVGSIVLPQRRFKAAARNAFFRMLKVLGLHSDSEGLPLRKLPNHINGSLWRHLWRQRLLGTGAELPQFDIDTPCGQRLPADRYFGCRFRVLGWNVDPSLCLDGQTLQRWTQAGGQITTITSAETFSTEGDLVLDRKQHYRETFGGGRYVLVIRPDKMIVHRCRPTQLARRLNHLMTSLGCTNAATPIAAGVGA